MSQWKQARRESTKEWVRKSSGKREDREVLAKTSFAEPSRGRRI